MLWVWNGCDATTLTEDKHLAYLVFMGTRDAELKEAILEFVKGNDNKITMAIMTEVSKTRTTINVSKKLASKKAQALKVSFTSPLSKEKGGSSGSGTDKGSGSGKNKKQEFVNFDKLDGEERLEAIKHLSLCVYCGNNKDHKKTKCVERNHICAKCKKADHSEKACCN